MNFTQEHFYRAITTRRIGCTTNKPARIVAEDNDGHKSISSIHAMSFTGDVDLHKQAANAFAEKMGWPGRLVGGYIKDGMVWVFMN